MDSALDLIGDIRLVGAVLGLTLLYALYEIYCIRNRVQNGLSPERRSYVGIGISMCVLLFLGTVVIPIYRTQTQDKIENLKKHQQLQEEQLRLLKQGPPISAAEHCPCFSPAGLVQQCNTGPRTTVILFGPLDGAIPKGSNVPNFSILDRPMTVIPCRDITVSLLNSQFEGEPIPGCWQMLYDEDYGVFAFSFSAGRAGC